MARKQISKELRAENAGKRAPRSAGIELRIPGKSFPLLPTAPGRLSFYWSYVVRSRGRWQDDLTVRKDLIDEALRRFHELGLTDAALAEIAEAGTVEISMPYADEDGGWAARILPWEFLLTEATRSRRDGRPLTVVRHLHSSRAGPRRGPPQSVLMVENAAGPICNAYSFEEELRWMKSQIGMDSDSLNSPTARQLTSSLLARKPDVVHLTGVDLHQGQSLRLIDKAEPGIDGLLMAGTDNPIDEVSHARLGEALNPRGYAGAQLVTFNFFHSAGRVAAAAVEHGAHAALGFQDRIDDEVAERFLAAFYREWRSRAWDLLAGFRAAFEAIRQTTQLRGTGIVLWTAKGLISSEPQVQDSTKAIAGKKVAAKSAPRATIEATPVDLHGLVDVRVQAPKSINYSTMHGGKRLFTTFTLYRKAEGTLPPIHVEVVLQAGSDSFPFRKTVRMEKADWELPLADYIHLPLMSQALRGVRETMRTGLFYRVTCGNEEIVCDTAEVMICPIDEWQWDPKDDSRWLGAFVLPRDPAVLEIVDVAQKYLAALQDDSSAGFDGYQSVDPELDDPEVGVEMQVRALWCALAFEINVAYVNPPPVFSEQSQRLRSPSEVVRGKRGTCIDLALMLAACLEYVDIYPVVFVLKDHAFPGFWRSEEAYERFLRMTDVTGSEAPANGAPATAEEFTTYEDVLRHVRAGDLVPIETVLLTRRLSFREAIEEGMENLKDRHNFAAILDVHRDRRKITPLPIIASQA
ncbi:CHAT domain-containing protein [Bradyrhizobium yuanmingense]|uniref:CHAT domain-containing protein n=1 Tax=Bradyrhizobium yuanmingense TaxID=108015 RepID=UPI0012FCBE9A|nr:CHAT domain-containing protein [Bradyrhizobium yuanmingense]MVT49205.1 CHAT domain-containing protein [Bradyrhizobium yuanmingense]